MALNFPNSPALNDIYTDNVSGFSYQWNGTVWISFSAASSSQIKTLDDISASFNNSTLTFALTSGSVSITPPTSQSLIINLGGVIQDATDDYSVSGSNIVFSTAPTNGLSFSGISLGPAIPVNTIPDGTVTDGSLRISTTAVVGSATTFTEKLVVTGSARVTGILTVGTSSITLNGITNVINVGTGLTLSSSGINVTGVITASSFSGNGSGLTGVGLGTTGSINTSGIITSTSIVVSAGTTALPSISPTGDSNTGIFFPSADTIAFSEGGVEALRVDSSGRLLIGISTSGNANGGILQLTSGITFPATAVAASDANTLDDYEEGTWTPVVSFGGASVGITGTFSGTYTKIGNVVTVVFILTFTSKGSSTGNMLVSGMPFNAGGQNNTISGFGFAHRFAFLQTAGQMYLTLDGTDIYPRFFGYNAGNTTTLTNTDIRDDTDLRAGSIFRV